jgi:23S rRNA pseudouridine2457 synthase
MDSEGLLLLTDDGRLAHQLTDPQHKITKTYLVQVEGDVSAQALATLQRGVEVKGRMTRRCRAVLVPEPNLPERSKPITPHGPTAWIRLELNEGMKRQIRHMTAVVGLPTLRLVRIAIGPVTLAGLAPGEWRRLTAEEISRLRQAAAGTHPGQYNKTKTNSPRSRGK